MFRRLIEHLTDSSPTEGGWLRGRRLSDARRDPGPAYVITFSAGDVKDLQMDWIGVLDGQPVTLDEVRSGFRVWLDTAPLSPGGVPERTVDAWVNGSHRKVTFRTDWVSVFSVQRKR